MNQEIVDVTAVVTTTDVQADYLVVVVTAKYYSSSLYSYYYSQTVDVDAEEDVANLSFQILKKEHGPLPCSKTFY